MKEVIALAKKDMRLLLRDKAGFFFSFIFPVLYASLFGVIMSGFSGSGGDRGMPIVVVDEDATAGSAAFLERLKESKQFTVTVGSREQAADLVRRGKRTAFVVLPPGFGAAREAMFFGDPPSLEIGVDPARQAEAAMLEGVLTGMLFEGMQDMFTNPDKMTAQIDRSLAELENAEDADPLMRATLLTFLPALKTFTQTMPATALEARSMQPRISSTSIARQREGPRSTYEISFPQGIVWGIMGCAAGFGISLVVERARGTLVRLRMAPVSRTHILMGKGLACLLSTIGVAVILLLVAMFVFGVRPSAPLKLAMAVLCVALCFVGIMMLLSVLGKTEQSAGGIGWAILMVMAMIGGGMVPLMFLPGWLQDVASISPIKWSILALEGALWRDFSYAELATPCGVLLGMGAACFAVGARAFRWNS